MGKCAEYENCFTDRYFKKETKTHQLCVNFASLD